MESTKSTRIVDYEKHLRLEMGRYRLHKTEKVWNVLFLTGVCEIQKVPTYANSSTALSIRDRFYCMRPLQPHGAYLLTGFNVV